jgi:ABC-type molybdate transport system ATPase subunit
MKQNAASRQPDLFDMDEPRAAPAPAQKEQLATLVEVLLREIAVALAAGEVGDDQDHG